MTSPPTGRWLLAGAAVLVQLALGAVYAWSVFVNPFIDQMGAPEPARRSPMMENGRSAVDGGAACARRL